MHHPTVTDQSPTLQDTLTGAYTACACREPSTGSSLPTFCEAARVKRAAEKAEGGKEGAVGGWFGGDEAQNIMEIRKQEKTEGI